MNFNNKRKSIVLRVATCVTLFFFQIVAHCQSKGEITIEFNNVSLESAFIDLEDVSGLEFYFDGNWLKDLRVNQTFTNKTVDFILKEILTNTPINYIVLESKVVLTKNNMIIQGLPKDYFKKIEEVEEEEVSSKALPVLQKQYLKGVQKNKGAIFYIGKEANNSTKNEFNISGTILDQKTGKPIENLNVFVDGINKSTVTDVNGYYSLRLPKGYHILKTSSIGYGRAQKQIVVYGNGTLSFNLVEEINELDEVVVNSNKDKNIRSVEIGVTSIDVKGIKNIPVILGERDVLKVATTMPGIKTAGEGALGYSVRGGKVDQNLILFDGAAIYNPSHFFGVFSAVNPFATGSVDIYKGSIPSEFGGRLSSVIDISTKEINKDKFSGEGNIGPVTGNLMLEVPVIEKKAAVLVGARATYSNWVLRSLSDESLQNSDASFYDALVKYEHKISDKDNIELTGYFSNDRFSITSDSIFDYGNKLGAIKWNHVFNDKNSASLKLATSQYKFNIIFDGDFNRNFDFGYNINETQLKLKARYLHSKKHKFTYGLSSKLYKIDPGYIKPIDASSVVSPETIATEKGLESAVYLSDLYQVNEKLSLDLGLRYSSFTALGPSEQNVYAPNTPLSSESVVEVKTYTNNEFIKTYGGPEFRLSARYFLSPLASLKASFNSTIQYSHLLSTNTTASPIDSWKLSDSNIKPQRAQQFSLGFYKNSENDVYEYSLEGYYKKMNNLLDFKVGADLLLNQNIETELLQGKGKAYGLELLIKKKQGRLNGWLAYSFSRTLVKLDSEFLTNRVNNGNYFAANQDRPHDVSLVSNFKLTKRYSFSMNFNYQSGRPITYPVGKYVLNGTEHVLYSDRNKFRVPDYYRLDLGINIEGNHKNVKLAHSFWNISVYNVLGRNNPFSVFFVNENGQVKGYQSSIFAIPVPTITYNFKF
ncbi:carboxypeptidase-like regulatory domain-containing protein [Seonamhaeicola marinus]|uniref:TonB-dependent receptor n=1 Tax=Seonamhaeicola marinus TaxID=1912246 RepID=A0A5D0HV34_9FLAO|nr:carboxypeptidase-like regulatory domain-containing protein [Seonamhaeicola marinus]TYA74730.1 TonB-dependent receptor [Seonamhaeicola marinus]